MFPVAIRLVGALLFIYVMSAYGRYISGVIGRGDYWTYALCIAATFAVCLWIDYRNKPPRQ